MTTTPTAPAPVALFGAGTIGGGWAATYLARGRRVVVIDPSPDIEQRLTGFLATVWASVRGTAPDAPTRTNCATRST